MRCSKAQEFLSLDLDGALPPSKTTNLQEHLDQCAACRSYREDLRLGQRLLGATEPELPENFDWKLQLRLNQTLKETAGEVAYPWIEAQPTRGQWLRNFGTAASVGLAAVLALGIILGPDPSSTSNGSPAAARVEGQPVASLSDRLPLESPFNVNSAAGRTVSSVSPFRPANPGSRILDRGWSGRDLEDLRTIQNLRQDNEKLQRMLVQSTRQLQLMRAQLDTTKDNALDLPGESR